MSGETYTVQEFEAAVGVRARTLRYWIRRRLLPKPLGHGRGSRYGENHLLRAHAIQHLRNQNLSLNTIRNQLVGLSPAALRELVPAERRPRQIDEIPPPPPAPTYPSISWQVVQLMEGLSLMVNPARGAVVQRLADEIYRHYAVRVAG
jgi:DNA-binding transcriptional MerR regulator